MYIIKYVITQQPPCPATRRTGGAHCPFTPSPPTWRDGRVRPQTVQSHVDGDIGIPPFEESPNGKCTRKKGLPAIDEEILRQLRLVVYKNYLHGFLPSTILLGSTPSFPGCQDGLHEGICMFLYRDSWSRSLNIHSQGFIVLEIVDPRYFCI